MDMGFVFAIAAMIVVAIIGGILSGFFFHQYLRPRMSTQFSETFGTSLGIMLCTFIVFTLMLQLNPDPPEGTGNGPTFKGTAIMTAFSALFWLPLYLVTYVAVRKRWTVQ